METEAVVAIEDMVVTGIDGGMDAVILIMGVIAMITIMDMIMGILSSLPITSPISSLRGYIMIMIGPIRTLGALLTEPS